MRAGLRVNCERETVMGARGVKISSPAQRREAARQTTENALSIINAERAARETNTARLRKLRLDKSLRPDHLNAENDV